MNRTLRSILAASAILCGFAAPTHAQPSQKIVFLTDAGPLGRHSLFFVAKEKGYYKAEGLDVEILGGRGSAATIREVAAGAATFGFADSGTLVISRANENVPVKMIGIVYARAPHAMMALKSSGITGPKDLVGRTLADTSASSNYILFAAYARASGIDPNSVKWVFTDFNSLPGLLVTKQVDAIGQFTMGQPMLQQRVPNDAIVVLSYKDAGMEFYSNSVVASDATIQSKPALVKAFMRATQKGMTDAFANPKEAAQLMHKSMPLLDEGIIAEETKAVSELAATPETKREGLGVLNRAKIAQTIEIIGAAFKLSRQPTVDEVASISDFAK
jgi:NitT/TauT family transport system substrate-binding protein